MERKNEANASTAAMRTYACKFVLFEGMQYTHRGLAVCESSLEGAHDHVLVLLLDNLRGCGEYPKGILALVCVWRLACLEQCAQKFGPCDTYTS
jgi:hypothetical protein